MEARTTSEQARHSVGGKRVADQLGIMGAVLSLWALIYPKPYEILIALLVVMPLLAFFLSILSKAVYLLETGQDRLNAAFLLPPLALAIRVSQDFNFLHLGPLFTAAIAVAAILALIVAIGFREALHTSLKLVVNWLLIWLLAAIYSYGSIAEANVLLDRSTPRTFTATVVQRRFSRRHRVLYLQLGPWGPRPEGGDARVTSSLYKAMAPGQIVCVELLPGALKIPWYYARSCRESETL